MKNFLETLLDLNSETKREFLSYKIIFMRTISRLINANVIKLLYEKLI